MGLAVRGEGDVAIIANYLLDAVQVVDMASGKIVRTILLGEIGCRCPVGGRSRSTGAGEFAGGGGVGRCRGG